MNLKITSLLAIAISILFSVDAMSQNAEYELRVSDIDQRFDGIGWLSIDSSTVEFPVGKDNATNAEKYTVLLPEGYHKIENSWGDYRILDTTIYFSPQSKVIDLKVNMNRDLYFYEFKDGFKKIYGNASPIIGLRDDDTFLMKRLVNTQNISYFVLETGKYSLKDDMLYLKVTESQSSSYKQTNIARNYHFTIKNDKIIDINKYTYRNGGE